MSRREATTQPEQSRRVGFQVDGGTAIWRRVIWSGCARNYASAGFQRSIAEEMLTIEAFRTVIVGEFASPAFRLQVGPHGQAPRISFNPSST